jgi:hypothetical protein
VAKRSRDAGNPKVTSVWLRYRAQCSRFPAFANAPPSLHEHNHAAKEPPPSEPNRLEPKRGGQREKGGRDGAYLMLACDGGGCSCCDEACIGGRMLEAARGGPRIWGRPAGWGLGFYPEIEARRRRHPPQRAREREESERGREI